MSDAYLTLRQKISAQNAERAHRYAKFATIWADAHAAGMLAGNAAQCTPMVVLNGDVRINGRALDPYKPDSAIADVVPDGVCGFAWIVVTPATCSFARWAAKVHKARREYGGGMCVRWVGEFDQSMTRKEAYAEAFAAVLRSHDIKAHARSRMD